MRLKVCHAQQNELKDTYSRSWKKGAGVIDTSTNTNMNISNTRKITERLNALFQLETENENIRAAVIDPINDGIIFHDICKIDRMAAEFQYRKISNGVFITLDQSKIVIMLSSIIQDNMEDSMTLPDTFFDALFESARFFMKDDLMKDPYLSNVTFPDENEQAKRGSLIVKMTKLPKYSPFFYSGPELYEPGNSIPRVGFVDRAMRALTAYKNGQYWGSVGARTILEENTISRSFAGNVLILGSDMGHFLYLTSLNPDVSKIIMMDNNQDALNLLESTVREQIPFNEKIAVITGDPLQYLMQMSDGTFDYVYISESVTCGRPSVYLEILNRCLHFRHTSFAISAESDLRFSYRNLLMTALYECSCNMGLSDSKALEKAKINKSTRNELNYIEAKLENVPIREPDDLNQLLEPEMLLKQCAQ